MYGDGRGWPLACWQSTGTKALAGNSREGRAVLSLGRLAESPLPYCEAPGFGQFLSCFSLSRNSVALNIPQKLSPTESILAVLARAVGLLALTLLLSVWVESVRAAPGEKALPAQGSARAATCVPAAKNACMLADAPVSLAKQCTAAWKQLRPILELRGIASTAALRKLLGKCRTELQLVDCVDKVTLFFQFVDPHVANSTDCLTSMVQSGKDVDRFSVVADSWIKEVASLPVLASVVLYHKGRGFPDRNVFTDLCSWEQWRDDGQFSMELFHCFSVLCRGRGFPERKAVAGFLADDHWRRKDGLIDLPLLHSFCRLLRGHGICSSEVIDAVFAWPCWTVDGHFDTRLFSACSMLLDMPDRPCQEKVTELLSWPCWQAGEGFDRARLQAMALLFDGRGEELNEARGAEIISWACWRMGSSAEQNHADGKSLLAFAQMLQGRGAPDREEVESFMAWLPEEGELRSALLSHARVLFSMRSLWGRAAGLPPAWKLRCYHEALSRLLPIAILNAPITVQTIKGLTLLLASSGSRSHISWCQCMDFVRLHYEQDRAQLCGLVRLHDLLVTHGVQGLRTFMALNIGDTSRAQRDHQLAVLVKCSSLSLAHKAMTTLPEDQWDAYVNFCQSCGEPLDTDRWEAVRSCYDSQEAKELSSECRHYLARALWGLGRVEDSISCASVGQVMSLLPSKGCAGFA